MENILSNGGCETRHEHAIYTFSLHPVSRHEIVEEVELTFCDGKYKASKLGFRKDEFTKAEWQMLAATSALIEAIEGNKELFSVEWCDKTVSLVDSLRDQPIP